MNKRTNKWLLPLIWVVCMAILMIGITAAVPPGSSADPARQSTVVWVLSALLAVLLACVILMVGLTQWAASLYRKSREEVKALQVELATARATAPAETAPPAPQKVDEPATEKTPESKEESSDLDEPDAKGEEPPFVEAVEEEPLSSAVLTPEEEAEAPPSTDVCSHIEETDQGATVADESPKTPMTGEERTQAMAAALASAGEGTSLDDMSTTLLTRDGHHIVIKYRQSFRARIAQADEESKATYSQMKNYLLSYEGTEAADSQNYESFSAGRRQLAKMNITGKTLVLYLALSPEKLEGSKYKYENVGDRKRFEKTPVKIKVRSARSYKWATELVDMAMTENGRVRGEEKQENFIPPYQSRAELIAAGLIAVSARDVDSGTRVDEDTIIRMIQSGAKIEAAPIIPDQPGGEGLVPIPAAYAAEFIPHHASITAEEAARELSSEVAVHHLYHRVGVKRKNGKQVIVNVDTLDRYFVAHDTVTLATLQEKKLVPASAGRLKILARGMLTKSLIVEADDFSVDALKMILITGGSAVEISDV